MALTAEALQPLLRTIGVMPVVTVSGASDGVALADALLKGGLPAIEMTLRIDGALDAIRAVAKAHKNMLVGAGTVRDARQAAECQEAGASFLVSPGLVPEVAAYAIKNKIAYLPGIATPTEMEMARAEGLSFLKLFPAEVVGGRGMLGAVGQAMPDFAFVPTGGITVDTMMSYLALANVVAVGGSWIASNKDIAARNWDGICANAQAAAAKVQTRA
ncbi:MAG: bifunctional 4-hydroxy-2-oxoglutarate aldolase/2-dehydro-3-deoxy-phosphogluconate aldolase [Beijerinckiaceae bacterium]